MKSWQSIGIDDKHQPDKRWIIDMLATFYPQDDIFKKSYLPPPKKNKLSEIKAVELPESFLKDLPISRRKTKRKGLKLQRGGITQQKILRLRQIQKDIGNRIIIAEQKKEERKYKIIKV